MPDDAGTNADIANFASLENAIVRHVASLDPRPTRVVWDDAERISDPELYRAVADDFFRAMPKAPADVPVDCNYDESTEVVTVTIDFNGKKSSASFVQQLDWVTSEFLDLIVEVTTSRAGRFVELIPGDQSFMFVYLKPSLAKSLEEYRARDADSRESVFTSQSESAKQRFKDMQILARREFRGALARLKNQLMDGDDPTDIASYRDGAAVCVATASKYDNALQLYTRARRSNTDQFAMLERWHHEAVCPDEDGYVLLMEDDREIIFERSAKYAGMTMGDQEKDFGSFLVAAKDGSWGIFAHDDYLICSGEKVLSLLNPLIQPVPQNPNGQRFVSLRDEAAVPLLNSEGFAEWTPAYGTYCVREYENHLALIDVAGRQESPDAPVEVSLRLRQYSPTIDQLLYEESLGTLKTSVWKMSRNPPGGESTQWTIDSDADLESVSEEILTLIRDAASWLEKPESLGEWQRFLEDEGDFLGAAAVAVTLEDRDNAQRLADLTLAEADNKSKYVASRDVQQLKAMGLKAK